MGVLVEIPWNSMVPFRYLNCTPPIMPPRQTLPKVPAVPLSNVATEAPMAYSNGWRFLNVGNSQCHLHHPPGNVTIFIGGINLPFPKIRGKHGALFYPQKILCFFMAVALFWWILRGACLEEKVHQDPKMEVPGLVNLYITMERSTIL
jgi:hypothetical protein